MYPRQFVLNRNTIIYKVVDYLFPFTELEVDPLPQKRADDPIPGTGNKKNKFHTLK